MGSAEVRTGQIRGTESGTGKVLPGEVPARQVIPCQANAGKVASLVAGGRVELCGSEARIGGWTKSGPTNRRAGEVGVGQRGIVRRQRWRDSGRRSSSRSDRYSKSRAGEIASLVAGGRVELRRGKAESVEEKLVPLTEAPEKSASVSIAR